MFKKKQIRLEFENYFKSGNETMIKKILEENNWLQEEWKAKMDGNISEQSLILAALGTKNDENGGDPVSVDDLIFCLKTDFKQKREESAVKQVLNDCESLGYCKPSGGGWVLTPEGERICDNYLNAHTDLVGPELE